MNGLRKTKTPSRKEMLERMTKAEHLADTREAEMVQLNKNWGMKFDMILKMFEAATEAKIDEKIKELSDLMDLVNSATSIQDAALNLRKCKELMEEINTAYLTQSLSILHWFKTWSNDVDSIDHTDPQAGEKMDQVIAQHGFEFTVKPIWVSHEEMCGRINH